MEKYQKKIKGAGISWDTLSHIHLDFARRLAAEGVNFGLSTPVITEVENRLNEIWRDCLHGKATLRDFEAINRQWADSIRAANKQAKRTTLF